MTWEAILFLIGAVCFAAAAAGFTPTRVNLIAAGLLAWILVPLIHTLA